MSDKKPWADEPTPMTDGIVMTMEERRELERRMRHAERLLEMASKKLAGYNTLTEGYLRKHLDAVKEEE